MYSRNLNDYIDRVLITKEQISEEVARLGRQISKDYEGKDLMLVGVLKGGSVFMSDLIRTITIPLELDFISVSSYGASTKSSGVVRLIKDVDKAVAGKHVLIVEDIVDTGLTLSYIKKMFKNRNPESVKICTAFDKPSRRKVDIVPEYKGLEIPDEYVVGYGLDYDGLLRNIPDLCVLKREIYEK
ncbi:MAG: hypoxanthine phosphoribosyltransferase [Clostridia bacterium]|nr:hypoxanthine phosphoribosyltransferase [Clostridia bacterium]